MCRDQWLRVSGQLSLSGPNPASDEGDLRKLTVREYVQRTEHTGVCLIWLRREARRRPMIIAEV